MKYLSIFLIIFSVSIACSTSEKTVQDAVDEIKDSYQSENEAYAANIDLEHFRTQLADAYAYRENEIPEPFNQIRVEQKEEKNLYEGYRIQIYSGEDVTEADAMAADFETWADTSIAGYNPEAYVFFRTPYYRVHVGDFHEKDRAIRFSNMVKRYFEGAWVVYDKVNPGSVPADTADIRSK